jgi:hypothetical protein
MKFHSTNRSLPYLPLYSARSEVPVAVAVLFWAVPPCGCETNFWKELIAYLSLLPSSVDFLLGSVSYTECGVDIEKNSVAFSPQANYTD